MLKLKRNLMKIQKVKMGMKKATELHHQDTPHKANSEEHQWIQEEFLLVTKAMPILIKLEHHLKDSVDKS
jgi:hypothetical protein